CASDTGRGYRRCRFAFVRTRAERQGRKCRSRRRSDDYRAVRDLAQQFADQCGQDEVSFEEFAQWLRGELQAGRLTEFQVADLLAQRLLFDNDRSWMEIEFRLKVVGYVANQRHVTDSASALLQEAAQLFPSRMLYFEPIGFRMFS